MTRTNVVITLVFDPDDSPERTAALRALARADRRVVVCEPMPGRRSVQWLANDILAALGKREEFAGSGRNAQKAWWRTILWLTAEQTADLVVARAGVLDGRQWKLLAQLAAICRLRLWLVVQGHPPKPTHRQAIVDWPTREMDFEKFSRALAPSRTSRSRTAKPNLPFPNVPYAEFTAFRATCRSTLTPRVFSVVDALYVQCFTHVSELIPSADRLELDQVASLSLRYVAESRDINECLTRLRGLQTALFARGLLARVDVSKLANNAPRAPLDQSGAEALRGYAAPEYACIGALVLAYGRNPYSLHQLRLEAITPDGELVGAQPSTPVAALLLAHRLQRLWDGARDTDPLFCRGHSGAIGRDLTPPASANSLFKVYRRVGHDTGLFTPSRWTRRLERSPLREAAALGISFAFLHREDR